MTTMQLVEQHIIRRTDERWATIDRASFLSKNLYNAANYLVRQAYLFQQRYLPYEHLATVLKQQPDYCALPRKVSQQVLKQLDHDWRAFFAALEEWQQHPEKFLGRPGLPKYKHKTDGRNLLIYTAQAVSQRLFKSQGLIAPSQLGITVPTKQPTFDQVRIALRKTHYVIEIVYSVPLPPLAATPQRIAAIDLGLNNLATVTFNQPEMAPLLVNGRALKAINQLYNKERARLQALLPKEQYSSRRLEVLTDKRNRQMLSYLHLASRRLIDYLVAAQIDTLVIGKNDGWKQNLRLGKRTNQQFVQLPHARFVEMLQYKAALARIQVILTDEAYTSKCSFLDLEPIHKHDVYLGRRVKRGLFIASGGRAINADVNGSFNILRKVFPNLFTRDGIAASVVTPVRLTLHEQLP